MKSELTIRAIPQLLHFAWGFLSDSAVLPHMFKENLRLWQDLNPKWTLQLNTPKEVNELVRFYSRFPYDSYNSPIQRCDACRPVLLHHFGGVYSDLDVVPHQAMDVLQSLYPNAAVLLCEETNLSIQSAQIIGTCQPIRQNIPELPRRIANYFMASKPGHPMWLEVMELMKQRSTLPIKNDYDILYTTGPDIISEVAHRAIQCYPDVEIVPKSTIDAIITHKATGSWRGVSRRQILSKITD